MEKGSIQGSTGVVSLAGGRIAFTPKGQEAPSVEQAVIYEKK